MGTRVEAWAMRGRGLLDWLRGDPQRRRAQAEEDVRRIIGDR